MRRRIEIAETPRQLYERAVEELVAAYDESVAARDRFLLVLSGGSTPRGLYALLAGPHRHRLDWGRVVIFFGDERCVPPEDPASNYRMARETLLDLVPVPPGQVHRIEGERGAEAAARRYERLLREEGGQAGPTFDLVLLGMGPDGHTASLFPGSPAAAAVEDPRAPSDALVVPGEAPSAPRARVSLSLNALNRARRVVFLVEGSSKAKTVAAVLGAADSAPPLPAGRVQPHQGEVVWLLDRASAAALPPAPPPR